MRKRTGGEWLRKDILTRLRVLLRKAEGLGVLRCAYGENHRWVVEGDAEVDGEWRKLLKVLKKVPGNCKPECPDSPNGKHEWVKDVEYDAVSPPTVCDHCGTHKPKKGKVK